MKCSARCSFFGYWPGYTLTGIRSGVFFIFLPDHFLQIPPARQSYPLPVPINCSRSVCPIPWYGSVRSLFPERLVSRKCLCHASSCCLLPQQNCPKTYPALLPPVVCFHSVAKKREGLPADATVILYSHPDLSSLDGQELYNERIPGLPLSSSQPLQSRLESA